MMRDGIKLLTEFYSIQLIYKRLLSTTLLESLNVLCEILDDITKRLIEVHLYHILQC